MLLAYDQKATNPEVKDIERIRRIYSYVKKVKSISSQQECEPGRGLDIERGRGSKVPTAE